MAEERGVGQPPRQLAFSLSWPVLLRDWRSGSEGAAGQGAGRSVERIRVRAANAVGRDHARRNKRRGTYAVESSRPCAARLFRRRFAPALCANERGDGKRGLRSDGG